MKMKQVITNGNFFKFIYLYVKKCDSLTKIMDLEGGLKYVLYTINHVIQNDIINLSIQNV